MQHTTIAVDTAKSVLAVAVSHRPGKVSVRHQLTVRRFSRFLAERAPATVVMEACGMAHHWCREAQAGATRGGCSRRAMCGPTCVATRLIARMRPGCWRRIATRRSDVPLSESNEEGGASSEAFRPRLHLGTAVGLGRPGTGNACTNKGV